MAVSEDTEPINWKETYRGLKKKLKILLHVSSTLCHTELTKLVCNQENECYQAELRRSQGQLLQATRDRTFLLERLMQYQNVESSASESEATDESEPETKPEPPKRLATRPKWCDLYSYTFFHYSNSRKKPAEPSNGPSPAAPKKKRTASSSSARASTSANTRSTAKSTASDKPAARTSTTRGNRPSVEMSDSSSGFAESLMNAR